MGWDGRFTGMPPLRRWIARFALMLLALTATSAPAIPQFAVGTSSTATADLGGEGDQPIALPFASQAGVFALPVRGSSEPARGASPFKSSTPAQASGAYALVLAALLPCGLNIEALFLGHPSALGLARTPTGPPLLII